MEKEKLRPKRRFEGFTDDWEQRKLMEMSDSFEYGLNAAAKDFDGVHKYIRITDIDDSSHNFLQNGLTSPNINLKNADNYKLQEGDILFARTGASVGKTYIYKECDGLVYYAGFLIRARIISEYDPRFIFQNTLSDTYNNFIKITSQRSGQPGVNAQEYGSFTISVPTKDEQTKIGTFFKQLDNLITLHQHKLDKLKTMKQAYLSEMFPQVAESIPKRRFFGITDAWVQRKLEETAPLRGGFAFKSSEFRLEGIPIVRISNILSSGEIGGEFTYFDEQDSDENYILPDKSAVLAMSGATTGKVSILNNDCSKKIYQNQRVGYFQPVEGVDYSFVSTIVRTDLFLNQLDSVLVAGAQPNVSSKEINSFQFAFPKSIGEQTKISQFFANLDNLIILHQRKLEKLQDLKKAYLNDLFI